MSAPIHRLERPGADWPQIPGYRLEAVLGRGSTGVVFRGVQLAVDRAVAVKVLHAELSSKPRIVGRLKREARTLARLHHPHLIAAIDMGAVDGRWWFAMEYVDGPTLADRIRSEGPLSEREALRLFTPLSEALVCLGDAGVVHRDVKPANVLLERGPRGGVVRARLADLGLAFAEDDPQLTAQGGTLGTPHYISPEQARDPSDVDARTDIWAFGATLFHALCGRPPFTGESMAEVLSAVLHARVPDPQQLAPHLGRGLALVVRKCLVRDPDGRYADARELVEDLERLRERRAPLVAVGQLDPLERTPGPWRRIAFVAGAAAVLALALSGLLLFNPLAPSVGGAQARPSIADEAALLDEILTLAQGDSARLAGAWREVEGLRDETTDEAWLPARAELLDRIAAQVDRVTRARGAEVSAALAASDFSGARALLDLTALEGLVRGATGFLVDQLPNSARGRLLDWRTEELRDVDSALSSAVERYREGVVGYREGVLLPQLARLVDGGQWRTALAETQLGTRDLVERAGLDPAGLPADELEAATLETRVRLATERVALESRWSPRFRELVRGLEDEAAARAAEARRTGALAPERLELAPALHAALERRGLVRDELPAGAWANLDQTRREAEAELRATVRDAGHAAAVGGFDLRATTIGPALLGRREFERAAELWRAFERDFLPSVRAGEGGRAGELVAAARAERDAAERLVGLLRGIAEVLRERRGESLELDFRNIGVRGELVVGVDPLADGFQLRSVTRAGEQRYPFDVRTLELGDLLALAGLDGDPRALAPERRLALALLLEAEGERARAQDVLTSGPAPAGSEAVVERLAARLPEPPRPPAATTLIAELDAGLAERDPRGAAALIDYLLDERLDQPAVALRSNHLRREREALERQLRRGADRPAELAARYPDATLATPVGGRGRVSFDGAAGVSFDLGGAWRRDASGAPAARAALGFAELAGGAGLALALGAPFDPRSGPWSVEVELDFAEGDAPRGLVLRGDAYLVAWGGEGDALGWVVGAGSEEELVERLRRGDFDTTAPGPRAGQTHRLRLEWDRPRGFARAYLDGSMVVRSDRAALVGPERPRVELRSLDPVVLRALEVEGPLH